MNTSKNIGCKTAVCKKKAGGGAAWEDCPQPATKADLAPLATRAEVAATKAEVAATRTEVAATKAEVAATKTEVTATKTEVAATKAEVTATKAEVDNILALLKGETSKGTTKILILTALNCG